MDGIPQQDDGLKWFGEGFDGFPKRLPDDCVEYIIYAIDDDDDDSDGNIDKVDDDTLATRTRTRLDRILKVAQDLVAQHLKDYIWQRDAFELKLVPADAVMLGSDQSATAPINGKPPAKDGQRPCLRGRTNFGDSIADEWVIVWLLRSLSIMCPDAWIRMHDTDGEFLLIEAASALPAWLNPDIAEHRVWLHKGHLRLIPLEQQQEARKARKPSPRNLSLQDALHFIRTSPQHFVISPTLQDAAFARLKEYPAAIALSLHHALIPLPRTLAHVLHRFPSSIAPAVEAFYLRDPIGLRPLMTATKHSTKLHFPPVDFVTISVRFTKVLYAQLRSQPFSGPPAWLDVLQSTAHSLSEADEGAMEMGMKLTCGFEMLVRDPLYADKMTVRQIKVLLDKIESGEEVLPTNDEVAIWPRTQDGEEWLDIHYADFERELAGGRRDQDRSTASTDAMGKERNYAGEGADEGDGGGEQQTAKENLRRMVRRFEDFLDDDDEAGADEDVSDDDDDTEEDDNTEDESSTSSPSSIPPSKHNKTIPQPRRTSTKYADDSASASSAADFQRAMDATRALPASALETSGLLAEARRLALEDAEQGSPIDDDKDMREVMALMERELKGHGALNLEPEADAKGGYPSGKKGQDMNLKNKGEARPSSSSPAPGFTKGTAERKVFFGPERPPHMHAPPSPITPPRSSFGDDDDDAVGPGDLELSSDDEEDNDVDLNLARNMLEAFKGQAGMQGPAGNMMKALGVSMPRDEG